MRKKVENEFNELHQLSAFEDKTLAIFALLVSIGCKIERANPADRIAPENCFVRRVSFSPTVNKNIGIFLIKL